MVCKLSLTQLISELKHAELGSVLTYTSWGWGDSGHQGGKVDTGSWVVWLIPEWTELHFVVAGVFTHQC